MPAPDYGIDAPRIVRKMFVRGITIWLLGIVLLYMNQDVNPNGGKSLFLVCALMGSGFLATGGIMLWSSRVGKLGKRDEILNALPWRGDEKVLDVGCGRGLLMIGAAKRTKTKVTGVDIWSGEDLSGNSADAAVANAKEEGVAEKVTIENSDARRLPYKPATFDTVVSSLAIHNINEPADRTKALDEMLRVTKPGGHIAIFDILHASEYEKHLQENGAEIVQRSGLSLLWCMPSRWFVARKKA